MWFFQVLGCCLTKKRFEMWEANSSFLMPLTETPPRATSYCGAENFLEKAWKSRFVFSVDLPSVTVALLFLLCGGSDSPTLRPPATAASWGLKSDGVVGFKNKAGRIYASEVLKCMARSLRSWPILFWEVLVSLRVRYPMLSRPLESKWK